MNFTVRNTGSVPLTNWYVIIIFPGDQHVTQAWNVSITQSGHQVTITPAPGGWNSTIPVGGSISFGVTGTYSGTWVNPTIKSSCTVI
jgi:Cellulose binding domain